MDTRAHQIGDLIPEWRGRRRMSQLDLALEAEISQRHLSFVESGRSAPSRDMVMRLAEQLDVPLRQRNHMLLAAGFAPNYAERAVDDDGMAQAMAAIDLVLRGHEPNPAIAVDRHWNLVRHNAAIAPFLADIADPKLLQPPVNVLRLSLHPDGMARRIVNYGEWRAHVLERLRRLSIATGDPAIEELEAELRGYLAPSSSRPQRHDYSAIAVPLKLRMGEAVLSFISTITVFGTPLDVTLSELAVESFFAADEATARYLQSAAALR